MVCGRGWGAETWGSLAHPPFSDTRGSLCVTRGAGATRGALGPRDRPTRESTRGCLNVPARRSAAGRGEGEGGPAALGSQGLERGGEGWAPRVPGVPAAVGGQRATRTASPGSPFSNPHRRSDRPSRGASRPASQSVTREAGEPPPQEARQTRQRVMSHHVTQNPHKQKSLKAAGGGTHARGGPGGGKGLKENNCRPRISYPERHLSEMRAE